MSDWLVVAGTGGLAGLMSLPHCAGMCGPLAAFACAGDTRGTRLSRVARHQLGRLTSYSLGGALAGALGTGVSRFLPVQLAGALFSWTLAFALGLLALRLASRLLPARARALIPTRRLVRSRGPSWTTRLLSPFMRHPGLMGAFGVLLPCGSLAGMWLVAAGTANMGLGALALACFALSSGGALVASAWLASDVRALASRPVVAALATVLAVGSLVMAIRPVMALGSDPESCHAARP